MLTGHHFIAGLWQSGRAQFDSAPVSGPGHRVADAKAAEVHAAAEAAEAAFAHYSQTTSAARAAFLNTMADEIDARGGAIRVIACAETGLPEARIDGERARTSGQLR